MSRFSLGLPIGSDATDHPMHLKARLAVVLQKQLLRHSHLPLSGLATRLQTNQEVLSDLLVLNTGNVTFTELRQFLLALDVPMQSIEAYLLADCIL